MNLTDLHTFNMVAETGSISAAAARLNVPKSTVSRRVQRLEDALGRELLKRSARAVSLSNHGLTLHQRTHSSLKELEQAAATLDHADAEPTGTLRLTTTPSFGQSPRFIHCLQSYGCAYPKVTLQVELTNRVVDLVEEGVDIGLRLHTGPLPGRANMMSRRVLHFSRAVYASPAYLAEQGTPSETTLDHHRLVAHSIVDMRQREWLHRGQPSTVPLSFPEPTWLLNDSSALKQLILNGAGIGLLSTLEVEAHIRAHSLVRLLPHWEQTGGSVSLVWPSSRYLSPRIRSFIDHSVANMSVEPKYQD